MSYDEILSTFDRATPAQLVFSLFASYGELRGGELPGAWFLRMLEPLGIGKAAIRQTLYRLTADADLVARRRRPDGHRHPETAASKEVPGYGETVPLDPLGRY